MRAPDRDDTGERDAVPAEKTGNVNTGDDADLNAWIVLFAVSLIAAVSMTARARKR